MAFPNYIQTDKMSCGATCLKIVAKYYGKFLNTEDLVKSSGTNREGTSLLGLSIAAEKLGFKTTGAKLTYQQLQNDVHLPCIAYWNQQHFVVVYKIRKGRVYISDPSHGLLNYSKEDFTRFWRQESSEEGIVLILKPCPEFDKIASNLTTDSKQKIKGLVFLLTYLKGHKKQGLQLLAGLLLGSLLQLIFPILTQSIVDMGIQNHDFTFITLILISQLMVFISRSIIEIIRTYILAHISIRINISLISDFFAKLMKLPIAFFDTKMTGDIMQRMRDTQRIESFLTGSSITTLFSLLNFFVFGVILAYYSINILLVWMAGSILYFLWILFFLKYRAELDYKQFQQSSKNQSKIIELITGMQEIKLNNCERQKRWQLESQQVQTFKLSLKGLTVNTAQNLGSSIINELKNIFITFMSARLVLNGELTIGMMLSTSYIIGQLNLPVVSMVGFIQRLQDTRISLERLSEIHNREDEEAASKTYVNDWDSSSDIELKNIVFSYESVASRPVLQNINYTIPAKKVTAIVGSSGSGKSTFLKLLLKFYQPTEGKIMIDQNNLSDISPSAWRSKWGVVMQEGYIFSDTIANNIAVGNDSLNRERLKFACMVANINDFIENLPLGINTIIGADGNGISTGQKQRILIARAVYKNPDYLFFDEATSALDTKNEKSIINNLTTFFKNKTVLIIAHRLSTVKNADNILVLEDGKIVESGSHQVLIDKRGAYYNLVINQLEIGN